jgi:hypothetical protein
MKKKLKSEDMKLPPLTRRDNWLPLKEELKSMKPSLNKEKMIWLNSNPPSSLKTETTKLPLKLMKI